MAEKKANDEWPSSETEFLIWFWKGQNGNNLIKKLNAYSDDKKFEDHIRREKSSPHIYAIVINRIPDNFAENEIFKKAYTKGWRFVKVGFTHTDTTPGSDNRMEKVKEKIEKKVGDGNVKILNIFRIGATDTTSFLLTEDRIRKKYGTPIDKKCAKDLGLPVHTEWAFTKQDRITEIKKKIKEVKEKEKDFDTIDIFKRLDPVEHDLPGDVKKLLLKAK